MDKRVYVEVWVRVSPLLPSNLHFLSLMFCMVLWRMFIYYCLLGRSTSSFIIKADEVLGHLGCLHYALVPTPTNTQNRSDSTPSVYQQQPQAMHSSNKGQKHALPCMKGFKDILLMG